MFQRFLEKTLESIPAPDPLPSQSSKNRQNGPRSSTSSTSTAAAARAIAQQTERSSNASQPSSQSGSTAFPTVGPDPESFAMEAAAIAGGRPTDSPAKRSDQTGKPVLNRTVSTGNNKSEDAAEKPGDGKKSGPSDLYKVGSLITEEMHAKLVRFDRTDSNFQEILKSYRIAHAKIQQILPFEAVLQENTPLAGIQDPTAFAEYLSQMQSQNGMVMKELQQASAERDELKAKVSSVQDELAKTQEETKTMVAAREEMEKTAKDLEQARDKAKQDLAALAEEKDAVRVELDAAVKCALAERDEAVKKSGEAQAAAEAAEDKVKLLSVAAPTGLPAPTVVSPVTPQTASGAGSGAGGSKKKKKKGKGRGGAGPVTQPVAIVSPAPAAPETPSGETTKLQEQITTLETQIRELEGHRDRLESRLKDQTGLEEEIETLRESLSDIGNDFVGIKDDLTKLRADKTALEATLEEVRAEKTAVEVERDNLSSRVGALESEVQTSKNQAEESASKLATAVDARQKATGELMMVRSKITVLEDSLRKTEHQRDARQADVQRISTAEAEIRAQLADSRDKFGALTKRLSVAATQHSRLEESKQAIAADLSRSDAERRALTESRDQLTDEITGLRTRLHQATARNEDLDSRLSRLTTELSSARVELESARRTATAREAEARELASQMREAQDRAESVEEDAATAHRILSERSAEMDSLRALLAKESSSGSAHMSDLRAELDRAEDDRARAVEEAAEIGRRRGREVADLNELVGLAEKGREAAEKAEQAAVDQVKAIKAELAATQGRINQLEEATKSHQADADRLEQQAQQERERTRQYEDEVDLTKQQLEQVQTRMDELEHTKSLLEDEIQQFKSKARTPTSDSTIVGGGSTTPASSTVGPTVSTNNVTITGTRHSRASSIATPVHKKPASVTPSTTAAAESTAINTNYIKHVFLQFLQLKDKTQKLTLVPVLSTLLQFEPADEQKLISAITSTW